jgi:hypothetical protein
MDDAERHAVGGGQAVDQAADGRAGLERDHGLAGEVGPREVVPPVEAVALGHDEAEFVGDGPDDHEVLGPGMVQRQGDDAQVEFPGHHALGHGRAAGLADGEAQAGGARAARRGWPPAGDSPPRWPRPRRGWSRTPARRARGRRPRPSRPRGRCWPRAQGRRGRPRWAPRRGRCGGTGRPRVLLRVCPATRRGRAGTRPARPRPGSCARARRWRGCSASCGGPWGRVGERPEGKGRGKGEGSGKKITARRALVSSVRAC